MAKVAAAEFSKAVVGVCSESKAVRIWDVKIFEDSVARIRIFLVDSSFIDVYYNAETKKISFAWIINNNIEQKINVARSDENKNPSG